MESEQKLEITPKHLAGQRVLQVIRDRANLVQQFTEYQRLGSDPVLAKIAFVKFVAPPQPGPDGQLLLPEVRFITPSEAQVLIVQDLERNKIIMRGEYDAYAVRRMPPVQPASDDILQTVSAGVPVELPLPASDPPVEAEYQESPAQMVHTPPAVEVGPVGVGDEGGSPMVGPVPTPENPAV